MLDKYTMLYAVLFLLSVTSAGLAQSHEVSGIVTDAETGETLPGVNILIQGTTQGTTTDLDGEYQINVDPDGALVFSYVGYEAAEIPVEGREIIDVQLNQAAVIGDELVVVGYGEQRVENLTGSVESISNDEINFKPVGRTSLALQGVAPGVTVTQNSGEPGRNSGQIRIRGIGTLGGGNDPLVVVDGVATSLNNFNKINPDNIQNISVLKDAASSAIYGSRAANGVILVTTKRAGSQDISVEYNGYIGHQSPTEMPDLVSGLDHMLLLNEANRNLGQEETFSENYIQEYRQNSPSDLYPDTDWQDLTLTNSGLMHNHSVSVSGGNEMIRVRGNINYMEQKGLIPNTGYERASLTLNSDINPSDKLNFRFDIRGTDEFWYRPSGGISTIFHYLYGRVPANQEGLLSDGRYGQGWLGVNPIADANSSGVSEDTNYRINLFLRGDWKPTDNLNISLMYSPEFYIKEYKNFRRTYESFYGDGELAFTRPNQNSLQRDNSHKTTDNVRALITYEKDFYKHSFSALAGFEQSEVYFESFGARRENFTFEDYQLLSLGSEENQQTNGSAFETALQSYFGRIKYDYLDKYLFEANVRYDGSSRFSESERFGLFPSFSIAWRLSQEEFFDNVEFVDELKFRASWGRLGNQEIGNYPYTSTVNLSQGYIFNESAVDGASLSTLGNPNITWETAEMLNLGLNLAFLQKFDVTADFYVKDTNDILLRLAIPETVGRGAPYQNAGKVRNTGWEFALNHFNSKGDFSYDISFGLSNVKNEIIDLKDTGPYIGSSTIRQEGYPIDAYYGYETDGLFQTQQEVDSHAEQFGGQVAPGDIKYVDQNNDGVINGDDRVVIGSNIPQYTFNLKLNTSYKNFDLGLFFQGVGEAEVYRSGSGVWAFYVGSTALERHKDRWTPDNTDASYPRLTFNYPNNEQVSDYWLQNAAYVRLKNVSLGYSFPNKWLNNTGLKNARLYASAQNLFTVDDFISGFDVESPSGSGGFYPVVKTYTIGLSIGL